MEGVCYFQMLKGCLLVFLSYLHPKFHIVFSLVGEEGLSKDSIKDYFSFHVQKSGKNCCSIFSTIFFEEINVLSH
jgi:hypothetical protein